jgi:hypothetical protein
VLSKDISTFSATPTAEVRLSAADAYMSQVATGNGSQTITVKLTAHQASQLQRGREIDIDLRTYRESVGK